MGLQNSTPQAQNSTHGSKIPPKGVGAGADRHKIPTKGMTAGLLLRLHPCVLEIRGALSILMAIHSMGARAGLT